MQVVLVLLLLTAGQILGDEREESATYAPSVASVNTKRIVGTMSDEFVSFYARPQNIFDGRVNPISEETFLMARSLGRMYLKVVADSSELHIQTAKGESVIGKANDSELVQITADGWKAFNEWSQKADVVPVFVLDYDGEEWRPKNALRILAAASGLGIQECLWQLGNGNITNAVKYIEDLRTLKRMLKAFPSHKNNWGIVACDVTAPPVSLSEAKHFHMHVEEIVNAIAVVYDGNSISLDQLSIQRGPSSHQIPLWLDVLKSSNAKDLETCDVDCLHEGLQFADILGEAAKNGYNAVFKTLGRNDIKFYTLNYLIALLHKQTIGNKVFAVQQSNPKGITAYAYCTRNVTGSLTVMAINHHTESTNLTVEFFTKSVSSPVYEYLITVVDGEPLLNNRTPDYLLPMQPAVEIKSLQSGLSLTLPPSSIAFVVIPNAKCRECRSETVQPRSNPSDDRTSTDLLLEDLIADRLEQEVTQMLRRRRRSVDYGALMNEDNERFRQQFRKRHQDLNQALNTALPKEPVKSDVTEAESDGERSARGPRQTQAYKRKQRRIRQKEKRSEMRNLRKLKRPLRESLRERGKRQLAQRVERRRLERMSARLASPKMKRSFLAEAVNQPPHFAASEEDEKSDFPQGDIHLLISKSLGGDADYISVEDLEGTTEPSERASEETASGDKRRMVSPQDFRFVMPESTFHCEQCRKEQQRRRSMRGQKTKGRGPFDRYMSIAKDKSKESSEQAEDEKVSESRIVEHTIKSHVEREPRKRKYRPEVTTTTTEKAEDEVHQTIVEAIESSVESKEDEDMVLFTPAPLNDSENESTDRPEEDSSQSEESGELVDLHRRFKRSLNDDNDGEVDRLEEFFRNNTKLQQKFAEMFDLLVEALEQLESEESDTGDRMPDHGRSKRNAPQPKDVDVQSNAIRRIEVSEESKEKRIEERNVRSAGSVNEEQPGSRILRSVATFVRKATSDFQNLFAGWLGKTSNAAA